MRCAECGTQNPEGSRFCFQCGANLPAPRPQPLVPVPPVDDSKARLAGERGFPVQAVLIGLAVGVVVVAVVLVVLLWPRGDGGSVMVVASPTPTKLVWTVVVTPVPPEEDEVVIPPAPPEEEEEIATPVAPEEEEEVATPEPPEEEEATVTPVPPEEEEAAPLTPPTIRRFLISTNCDSDTWPYVYGDRVVWNHGESGGGFYAYDLVSGEETRILSEEADHYRFAGDLLVWPANLTFWGYGLGAEGAGKARITSFQSLPATLRIGGGGRFLYIRAQFYLSERVLVWADSEGGETKDILAYDLERNERVRITDDDHEQEWPAAWGSLVVWADQRSDDGDIYAIDLDSPAEFPIVTAPLEQTTPSTDGRHVVWIDGRAEREDVYAYDLETRIETPIVTGPNLRLLPAIWGNTVIWIEVSSASGDMSVHGYDLRLGVEFTIAGEEGNATAASVWDDVVVWREYQGEDQGWAIFGAVLEY